MIDSSALLLTIVMTTPAEYHDSHNNPNFVSFNSMGEMMQRLCWPHTHTMNLDCEVKSTTNNQVNSQRSATEAPDILKLLQKRVHASHQ